MKKSLLFVVAMLFATAMMAQNRNTLLQESFDGSSIPTGWSIAGLGSSNWSISATTNAGGSANELKLDWSPEFNGMSRFVSPTVDLTGVSSVVVSFKHYLDNYDGSNTIGVATSSDGGTTWNEAWSQGFSNSTQYAFAQELSTPDMGNANVQFCIFFNGNSYNINDWYFDDIEIYTLENLDLGVSAINVPDFTGAGDIPVGMQVFNYGVTPITSVEASYQIDENEPVNETFSVNIPSLGTAALDFTTLAALIPGSYSLTVNILSANGTQDDVEANNTLAKSVSVALGSTQKIPMIEHFSSSTCGPCVSVNTAMLNLCNNNPGKFTYTKYQMNWPGSGDPYYTEEGGVRRNHYGVNAVPQVFMDGEDQGYSAATQATLDAHYNTPAFAEIRGAFTVEGNTIHVSADIMSYIDMNNMKAYVTVNEKETHNNVGGNGETSFHHIMMKMLPDANGSTISIAAGEYYHLEFTQDMSSTHVEEMSDLEVSVWVEDYNAKSVFNSHFLYENTDHPYAPQKVELTEDETGEENIMVLAWEAPEQGNPLGYNVFMNGELVAENTTDMSYTFTGEFGTFYVAEVQAVYDNDMTSVKVVAAKTNTWAVAENTTNICRIYPNPANNTVRIDATSEMQQINIYNTLGALVESINVNGKAAQLNLANYSNGVYFININHAGGSSTQRLVITH